MYKRVESGGYKVLLFFSLLVILIGLVVFDSRGSNKYFANEFLKESFKREIPLFDVKSAYAEADDFNTSTLFNIIGSGLKRELNLMGITYVQAQSVYNDHIGIQINNSTSEFSFDYGTYENRDVNLKRELSDKNLVAGVYNPHLVFNYPTDKPQVLIYHTHTGEGYDSDNADERDDSKNVVAVGEILAEELRSYGINVIHDKTIHDDIDYDRSYEFSGNTLNKYLNKYGDMDLVIDIHRDSVDDKSIVTTKLNGKDVARIMFVLERGNQNFNYNNKVKKDLQNIANALFPGLMRQKSEHIYGTAKGHLNQDKSKAAVLIEVGAHTNKPEEAKETAKYLGRIMAEYLYKKFTVV